MTRDADLKQIVRARMDATGETYTAAREHVLATPPPDPFYDKTIRNFFDDDVLRSIPVRRRARTAVLLALALRFEPGRDYPEKEVNAILAQAHEDYAWLRRELADIGYLSRADGVYRRTTTRPPRAVYQEAEVPVSEAARLGWT